MGTNPIAVRRFAWVIGTVFAAMSGVLLAPTIGLNALLLVLLVVQAFGAAAVGYFSNLPLVYIGGLAIGIASSVSTKYVGTISWLGGLPASLPFIVLFVALLVTPKRLLTLRRTPPPPPPRSTYTAPPRVTIGMAIIAFVLLWFIPSWVGNDLSFWTVGLLTVILFLSLGLLIRESGQVSLCQYAFAAVGAAAFSHLAVDHHVPWLLAVLLAGLVTVPVGLFIALPAIRLSGVFLALATLGFGILLEKLLYTQDMMFGATADGLAGPRPSFAQSDKDYYYVVLVAVVIVSIVVVAIVRGRLGRLLLGLRDSPVALDTEGATTNTTRVLVFCISSMIAGIFGALYAGFLGSRERPLVPVLQLPHDHRDRRPRGRWCTVVRADLGRVSDDPPELHSRRQHRGVPADLLRSRRHRRGNSSDSAADHARLAACAASTASAVDRRW